MFEHPAVMMILPAALSVASMLAGYAFCSFMSSRQTETLEEVSIQLRSLLRAQLMAGGRDIDEWQSEIDGLNAEISELRSLVAVHESEVELACETIDRLRSTLNATNHPNLDLRTVNSLDDPDAPARKPYQKKETSDSSSGDRSTIIRDDWKGWIYPTPPVVTDELHLIIGISAVQEARLNDLGVYTFEQIMRWDETNLEEFSSLLETFEHRIMRDDWIGQARVLYEKRIATVECSKDAA